MSAMPLHGERGGPDYCIPCGIEWHAKNSKKRKAGRIVMKALRAFFAVGGTHKDIDRLKSAALGFAFYADEADTTGANTIDITTELLEDAIRLTRHYESRTVDRRRNRVRARNGNC